MQIEHVWPQIPPDSDYGNWRPELKEKHSKIVDLLGNLILLDQSWNASLSNRLPSQKRDEYLNREKIGSNLAMVRELANQRGKPAPGDRDAADVIAAAVYKVISWARRG